MKRYFTIFRILMAIFVSLPAVTLAQTETRQKSATMQMHHETPGDAYLPHQQGNMKTSPAYQFRSSLFFTTQVNVNQFGENILGDAANEPSIAIDPTNPDRMLIGWRQFDDVNNNFRQAGYGYTTDGGTSWTFPGVITPGTFRSDPVLECDSDGKFYYNSLTVDGGGNYSCDVFRNLEGGFTWDAGTFAQGGDKQWMVIDKTSGMGDGNIYSFWTSFYSICYPGFFTRSIDAGNSYEECVEVNGYPHWGTMAVGPDGELYIAGAGDWGGIVVAKSTNAQNPLNPVGWDFYSDVDLDGEVTGWVEVNPEGLMGQVNIDVDRSDGPGHGNVYVVASVQRYSNGDPGDVMFTRSTDGGQTWSAPVRINSDLSTSNYQWFGTMSVSPNGRIDVIWLDTRDASPGSVWSALYYSYSFDQGETWEPNEKLSESFDPHVGWPNQQKMGDYFDMESDNDGAHIAWANTLNGEQDVYYGRTIMQYVGIEDYTGTILKLDMTVHPNPVHENMTISYDLPFDSQVNMGVYDIVGNEIRTLACETQQAGKHRVNVNTAMLPEGFYFCRLTAGRLSETIRLVKMK